MVQINPQINNLKESATLAINNDVKKLRSQGKHVCHFGFGQSAFAVPRKIQQSIKDHAAKKNYLPGAGLDELCQAIAKYYQKEFGFNYTAEDILVGPGSKELLFQLLCMLQGPLIVPSASWVSYVPQANLLNKDYFIAETFEQYSYCLQAKDLVKSCERINQLNKNENIQKILIINSPNNPTGAVYSKQNLENLSKVCQKYNIIVISDEIYAGINFSDQGYDSMVHFYPEKTIVTAGLSKFFTAGGYRLGFCLIPNDIKELYSAVKVMISETYSCVANPIQYAALTAYDSFTAIKPYLLACTAIYKIAAEYLYTRFVAMGLTCPKPQGAFYLFINFKNFKEKIFQQEIKSSTQLAKILLSEISVAMLLGEDFYRPPEELTFRVATTDFDGNKALQIYKKNVSNDKIITSAMPNLIDGCNRLETWLSNL